ncbi:glutaminyl-peptide cyclotransferase-like protein [Drosophila pseudoobscura]|uniref:glutaminyl-peptide cyclotransferase n=1 Tax=Drosophila pseudoobscura pseudoobscura TaxID=46245 RepID=A0A6I8UB54_DROPS|nr:glutaminyl-peptide cyclotransferase-like protein [Drosophila pseudoobscura]
MLAWIVTGVCLFYLLVNFLLLHWAGVKPLARFINDENHLNATLARLLKPRWPGSLGHSQVRDFLLQELLDLGFHTDRDEFVDGVAFTNVMGTINPEAPNFLLLCCHYDTVNLTDVEGYLGATDGAVSCAILLNMAKTLGPYLREELRKRLDIGLALVFFDGHEPMPTDRKDSSALRGSKRFVRMETLPLESIELAIALNFIGAPAQAYMSHYDNTYMLHNRLAEIELDLRGSRQLAPCHLLFQKLKDHDTDLPDDHYPFLDEGVPVIHLAPYRYPQVWHTAADNAAHLHWPTVLNMNSIIRQFVHEYLENHDDDTTYRLDS